MATIHSVLMEVSHDAAKRSSYDPGVWEAAFCDNEEDAEAMAWRFNDCNRLHGVRYLVMAVDDESAERFPPCPWKSAGNAWAKGMQRWLPATTANGG